MLKYAYCSKLSQQNKETELSDKFISKLNIHESQNQNQWNIQKSVIFGIWLDLFMYMNLLSAI